MNSRALRRLAADHGALHHQELPPNYLFPASSSHSDDLTQLDILIAGPTHTPFAAGVWKLHLAIPPTYPQQPPTANFRTHIFHPNVDPQTGGVCVETLKRDWDSKLTLRDVLVTISCLLIQPNPDSALNAEAGALIQEDYANFARRAELMTSIHAVIPKALQGAVREAQNRGQEQQEDEEMEEEVETMPELPARRRRTIAQVRGARKSEMVANALSAPQPPEVPQRRPFLFQAGNDDVFNACTPLQPTMPMEQIYEDDTSMDDQENGSQENDSTRSPSKSTTPMPAMTPRRPHGVAVPLGELIMEREDSSSDMEPEYPPSPRKSPSKSSPKRRQVRHYDTMENMDRPESSRDAALRAPNVTPPNYSDKPLTDESFMDVTFENSPSPHKKRRGLFGTPLNRPNSAQDLFGNELSGTDRLEAWHSDSFANMNVPSSTEKRNEKENRLAALESHLWNLCGGDIKRWNSGDFDGQPFKKKAGRW